MFHPDKTQTNKKERNLRIALVMTASFTVVEFVGGLAFESLALVSDAAHMFTDSASLIIALAAIQIGKRVADAKRTFGYYRFEILAAMLNAIILFLVSFYIFYEAYQRLSSPTSIDPQGMMIVALFGLIVNFISIRLLHEGSRESLNIRGAYLEAWADLFGSIGVIIAAIIIWLTGWQGVDSIVAIVIGLWILPRSWVLLKESVNILLEGVPAGIELKEIQEALTTLPHVTNVHDLHIWAVTSGKISLTVHLVAEEKQFDLQTLLNQATQMLKSKFNIHHSTLQVETKHCGHDDLTHLIDNH